MGVGDVAVFFVADFIHASHLPSHSLSSLLGDGRAEPLNVEQRTFARSEDVGLPLIDVIKKYEPTILIGVTAVGGLFTEDIVREMAARCDKPIVFPLSNPTTKAECTAEQAYEWTDGRCVFASGSPFASFQVNGNKIFRPSQCNNMYIFPGLGLGATVCGAEKVTDRMLYVAAETLANCVSDDYLQRGQVFPPLKDIRTVSLSIAVAVIEEALRDGIATKITSKDKDDLRNLVSKKMYFPEYVPLVEKREVTI